MTTDQIAAREADLAAALKTATDLHADVKQALALGQGTAELKEQTNKAIEDVSKARDEIAAARKEIADRQDEFEAKAAERIGTGGSVVPSRRAFTDGFTKSGLTSGTREAVSVSVDTDAFRKTVTNLSGSGGPLLVPEFQDTIVAPGQRAITIPDLVAPGSTSAASVSYPRELAVTNNAQVQATQGSAKGVTTFTFEMINTAVATIAHVGKISRQMMDDVPALVSYIEGRMRHLLDLRLEDQMLNGTGANGQLQGIKPLATVYDATLDTTLLQNVANQQILDVIGIAAFQVSLSEFEADGITINPREGWRLRLLKNADHAYLFANPTDSNGTLRPWGLPAVETRAEAADAFTIGAWRLAAQLFTRENVTARLATENEDDFVKNLVTLLVEMRAAQAVYRPNAFVRGTFTAALAP